MNAIEETARPAMSNFTSRILVAVIGLPLVLRPAQVSGNSVQTALFVLVAVRLAADGNLD